MEFLRDSLAQNEELSFLDKSLQRFMSDENQTEKIEIHKTYEIPSFLKGECLFTQCAIPDNSSSMHQRIGT